MATTYAERPSLMRPPGIPTESQTKDPTFPTCWTSWVCGHCILGPLPKMPYGNQHFVILFDRVFISHPRHYHQKIHFEASRNYIYQQFDTNLWQFKLRFAGQVPQFGSKLFRYLQNRIFTILKVISFLRSYQAAEHHRALADNSQVKRFKCPFVARMPHNVSNIKNIATHKFSCSPMLKIHRCIEQQESPPSIWYYCTTRHVQQHLTN